MADSGAERPRVRVVWGAGTGPTAVASYDAALAEANVHDYNLATVSSVVPPGASVDVVGTAPDLGPAGGRLWVLESRATVRDAGRATAALGWATGDAPESGPRAARRDPSSRSGDGAGLLYEAAGELSEAAAREQVADGLAAGRALRDRDLDGGGIRSISVEGASGTYATAVVLAAFGESEPMF